MRDHTFPSGIRPPILSLNKAHIPSRTAAGASGAAAPAAAAAGAAAGASAFVGENPPHKLLFVENLPHATTAEMLTMLFQQFPGFSEVRMVPNKPGIAFVHFETDSHAGVAKSGMDGFKIMPENPIKVTFAKR